MKTVQLRRYEIIAGEKDAFIAWWSDQILPLRLASGFDVEFAYWDDAAAEFVWAVSTPGDASEFARIEAAYLASDGRATAFDGVPKRTASQTISLVDVIH